MDRDSDGAKQILSLAKQIAGELQHTVQSPIKVLGWIGDTGHQGVEFAVTVGDFGGCLEVGLSDLLTYPNDAAVQSEVDTRIRLQLQTLIRMAMTSFKSDTV